MTKAPVVHLPVNGVDPLAAESRVRDHSQHHDWVGIVTQIQCGENAGIEELYRVLNRGIRYYLGRQLGDQDLEDKLHEILLIVVSAIQKGHVREPERIMGFVRTVAQRQVAAHIQRVVHSHRKEGELTPGLDIADRKQDPERLAMMRQKMQLMKNILAQMSERQREILVRFYCDEQTPEQICQEMALTETQFRVAKSRAKAVFSTKGQHALRKPAASEVSRRAECCGLGTGMGKGHVSNPKWVFLDEYREDRIWIDTRASSI
jgi:RNA polymerase sigma-70 factor (ECF subfamily)